MIGNYAWKHVVGTFRPHVLKDVGNPIQPLTDEVSTAGEYRPELLHVIVAAGKCCHAGDLRDTGRADEVRIVNL